MGIKDLWSILLPFCERKPLYELQGKVVAVDLSCWICEAQNISEYQVQPRMYLRNLYFRTCYLLLMEVIPVFVLEGKAPELKYQTIADRNGIQFKGAKPKSDKIKTGKDRSRFHFILKQCEDMLRYMGLACITGSGEAESMCAYLNEDGMVAGCISQDSDCFAYGAKVVFRNFSISSQGSYAASGGAVDVYDIQKANDFLNFGRNKIIALALLCGSDYNEGVHGVGKDSALKFINKYEDSEILNQMRSWRQQNLIFNDLENKIRDKNICTSCGHIGKVQSHTKSGCLDCKTTKGCDFSKYRNERLEIKNELMIRTKALVDPNFPSEELINEYLIKKDNVKKLDLRWKQPNLVNFVKFTNKFLGWEEIYAFEKFLPILARWQVLNYSFILKCISENHLSEIKGILQPKYIKKTRSPKGVASYEIIWHDENECFKHVIPDEQIDKYKENNKDDLEGLWSTIEPKDLVEKAYPLLVQNFLEKKNEKAKRKTKRKKKDNDISELNKLLQNTSITEPTRKKTRITKKEKQKTIDNYIKYPDKNLFKDTERETENIKPKTKVNMLKEQAKFESLSTSFDFNASNFGDEDDLDISDIIDDIVSRKPKFPEKIKNLGFCIRTPNKTDIYRQEEFLKINNINSISNSNDPNFLENSDDINILYSTYKIHDSDNGDIMFEKKGSHSIDNASSKKCDVSQCNYFGIKSNNINEFHSDLLDKSLDQNTYDNEDNLRSNNLNQSSFFETNYNNEIDLFEKSLNKKTFSDTDDSDENTVEYSTDNIEDKVFDTNLTENEKDFCVLSFEEDYVPLIERLKRRK